MMASTIYIIDVVKISVTKHIKIEKEIEDKKNKCKKRFERFKEICANLLVYGLILYFSYEAMAFYFVEY